MNKNMPGETIISSDAINACTRYDFVSVQISKAKQPVHQAYVLKWWPVAVKCIVSHPELPEIDILIANKAQRRDIHGFNYNAGRRFELVEALTNRAVYDALKHYSYSEVRLLNSYLLVTAIAAILSFTILPEVISGFYVSLTALILTFIVAKYKTGCLQNYLSYKEKSFEERKAAYLAEAKTLFGVH